MIWLLAILQVACVKIGWWVYQVYFTQPSYNHPSIFWNPLMRTLLIYGPSMGIVALAISAFFLTSHPWLFLVSTIVFWGYCGHKRNTAIQSHTIPSLSDKEVGIEPFSDEELLADIRKHKQEISQNKDQ